MKENLSKNPLIPAHARSDASNRIDLPKNFSACIPWIRGQEKIPAWLLLLSAGRFRLLSDEEVKNDPQLGPVRSLISEGASAITDEHTSEPTFSEEVGRAALVARLLPTEVFPHGQGWRITFPKAFRVFAPDDCDKRDFMILFSLEGYGEIWYTNVLRKAAVLPLDSQQ
jgi:hypothetical protein